MGSSKSSGEAHWWRVGSRCPAPARPPRCSRRATGRRRARWWRRGKGATATSRGGGWANPAGRRTTGCWTTRCCCWRWWSEASWRKWRARRRARRRRPCSATLPAQTTSEMVPHPQTLMETADYWTIFAFVLHVVASFNIFNWIKVGVVINTANNFFFLFLRHTWK